MNINEKLNFIRDEIIDETRNTIKKKLEDEKKKWEEEYQRFQTEMSKKEANKNKERKISFQGKS